MDRGLRRCEERGFIPSVIHSSKKLLRGKQHGPDWICEMSGLGWGPWGALAPGRAHSLACSVVPLSGA